MRDMVEKGRGAGGMLRGADNPHARLTEAEVREVLETWPAQSLNTLATRFGVTKQAISAIVNGRTWAHLPRARRGQRPMRVKPR